MECSCCDLDDVRQAGRDGALAFCVFTYAGSDSGGDGSAAQPPHAPAHQCKRGLFCSCAWPAGRQRTPACDSAAALEDAGVECSCCDLDDVRQAGRHGALPITVVTCAASGSGRDGSAAQPSRAPARQRPRGLLCSCAWPAGRQRTPACDGAAALEGAGVVASRCNLDDVRQAVRDGALAIPVVTCAGSGSRGDYLSGPAFACPSTPASAGSVMFLRLASWAAAHPSMRRCRCA